MLLRALTGLFGLASLCWALTCFGIFVKSYDVETLARQIISGENFKDKALTNLISTAEAIPAFPVRSSSFVRSESIARVRYLESAVERADPAAIDARMPALKTSIRSSLSLAPADPFLWAVLFWLENNQNGFRPDNLKLLAMSYDLGPREGWVALRRNRLALTMFGQLDTLTQDRVVAEFVALVSSDALSTAASNLLGPGWSIRDRLIASLGSVDLTPKERLTKIVLQEGFRIVIPGVPEAEWRPWR